MPVYQPCREKSQPCDSSVLRLELKTRLSRTPGRPGWLSWACPTLRGPAPAGCPGRPGWLSWACPGCVGTVMVLQVVCAFASHLWKLLLPSLLT